MWGFVSFWDGYPDYLCDMRDMLSGLIFSEGYDENSGGDAVHGDTTMAQPSKPKEKPRPRKGYNTTLSKPLRVHLRVANTGQLLA